MRTRRPTPTGSHLLLARSGRALLAAVFGLLSLVPASAAGAAESGPALRWKSGNGSDDAIFSGTVGLRGDVVTDGPVDGWSISILTGGQDSGFGVICRDDFKRPRDRFDVDCRWDTTRYPDQGPSANGHYLIRLMTHHENDIRPAGPDRAAAVNNRASAPRHVAVSYDENSGKHTLTWTASPEPDIAHYVAEQKTGRGKWTRIAETKDPRFEVTLPEPHDYRFRVATERRNADGVAGGPGPWTQATPVRESGSEGTRKERAAAGTSQPATDRRPGSERPPSRARNRRPDNDAAPVAEKPSPSSQPNAGSADGTPRKSASAQGSTEPDDPAGTRTSTAAGQPAPADRAALSFSPSSANPLLSLRSDPAPIDSFEKSVTSAPAGGKPFVASKPLARPAPEPDPGFTEVLPYEPLTQAEAAAVAPEEPAAASPPTVPATGSSNLRMGGIGLIAAGVALLGLAVRPRRRGRRRRTASPPTPVPAGGTAGPAGEPAWLTRLESCITRLEVCLIEQRGDVNHGGSAADLT